MVVEEKYYHHPLRNIKPANILSKWQTGREFLTVSSRSHFTLKTCIFKFRNRIAEDFLLEINTQFWAKRQDVKADRGHCSRD